MDQVENNRTNQKTVFLAFGSNQATPLENSAQIIQSAYALLSAKPIDICAFSPLFRTPAFPAGSGPDYVNAVVCAHTSLNPQELLATLHDVEAALGRTRQQRWGARLIDIDLLDYDGCVLPTREIYDNWRNLPLELQKTKWPDELILPHPRIQDRGFVLVPLKTVAPDWVHPVTGDDIDALIGRIDRKELVEIVPILD